MQKKKSPINSKYEYILQAGLGHFSPSNFALCLLTSASFPFFLVRSQKSGRCCEDIGQMPWQQPPKEVCWFGCLQGYAARGIILVLLWDKNNLVHLHVFKPVGKERFFLIFFISSCNRLQYSGALDTSRVGNGQSCG